MKNIAIVAILFFSISAAAQKIDIAPMKLLVLKPISAKIDDALNNEKDSLSQAHIRQFYRYLKTYDDMANCNKCDFEKEDVDRYKKMVADLKMLEVKIKNYSYLQLLSFYSKAVYDYRFRHEELPSAFNETAETDTTINALQQLATREDAPYIIYFSDIHTVKDSGKLQLILTTSVYSRKENKLIFTKTTQGDDQNRKDIWECDSTLSCLIMNAVHSSTDAIITFFNDRREKVHNGN